MRSFIREAFSCVSRLLNVLLGGTADLSLSARVHRDGWKRTERVIDWVFEALFGELDHCRMWWTVEVARAQETVKVYLKEEAVS